MDPSWNLPFADVLQVAGLLVTLCLYLLQRQKRMLGYRIMSVSEVPPYDFDRPETTLHEIAVEYSNAGNVPLLAAEFLDPVTTDFVGSKAVTASELFIPAFAENAPAQVWHGGTQGFLKVALLNPGERTRAAYRVQEFGGRVQVRSRIVGVSGTRNTEIFDLFWSRIAVLAILYIGFLLVRPRADWLIETSNFLVLGAPFVGVAVVQLIRVLRAQQLM